MNSRRLALVAAALAVCGFAYGQQGRAQEAAAPKAVPPKVARAQFEKWMMQYSNWGRWGKDDRLGTLNTITPAKRMQASDLVKTGTVVSLARQIPGNKLADAQPFSGSSMAWVGNQFAVSGPPQEHVMERQIAQFHGVGYPHIDALCHVAHGGKLYNGLLLSEVVTEANGCSTLNTLDMRGGVVTRGILIDLPGKSVTPADVLAWEKVKGIKISAGDAIFLRSGSGDGKQIPGAGWDPTMMPFLRERDVAIIGHDGGNEGGAVEGMALANHRFTLVYLGMHLLDLMQLEELAAMSNKMKRWEFMLTVAPPPVSNGSGYFVNPLAIF